MTSLAVAKPDVSSFERGGAVSEPLSRLGVPDESSLPAHVKAIYDKFRSHYGFIPNWLAALSINPDSAYRLVTFYEHLFDPKRSHLSAEERELIAVVTSATNHCSYCVLNHTQALAAATGDRPRAQRIGLGYHHVHLSPRELALAETVERLTATPTAVGEEDFGRLRTLGFSNQAIAEILEISAFFSYANRLTIALNVIPDRQFFSA
jgi:uncharacterized peroxidase-related enzyme